MISFEQKTFFPGEFTLLKYQKEFSKTSNKLNLTPFYDAEFDVMRVGGQMGNFNFSEMKNIPLPIPNDSPIVSLIIRHFH